MASSKYHGYPPSSGLFLIAGILAFLSTVLLLVAFASPYWLESWTETYSEFKRLGLWEACFEEFRYPKYQYDKKFQGCHSMYSPEYRVLLEWILPGWLMAVQAFMCIAFILSLATLCLISVILMRFWLRHEIYIIIASSVTEGLTVLFLLLAVSMFGGNCFNRNWIMYPLYNHLSWAYVLAVVACFFHLVTAVCLYFEIRKARDRKRKANTLVRKVDSASSFRY